MAEILEFVRQHGRQRAIEEFPDQRDLVEVASRYAADEDSELSFLFSGWCQAALPHKAPRRPDKVWEIGTERVSLIVEPLQRKAADGSWSHAGVPFGSRARLILYYLQTEAVAQKSREVLLGNSLHHWMERMGVPIGGKSADLVIEQCERISYCHFTFEIRRSSGETLRVAQPILHATMFQDTPGQPTRATKVVCLSEEYFSCLRNSPVPLERSAIRALSRSSQALDIYAWLAYRLHSVDAARPAFVSWKSLRLQFAGRHAWKRERDFRDYFKPHLRAALEVYPEARVEVVDEHGLKLFYSKPPVMPKTTILLPSRSSNTAVSKII